METNWTKQELKAYLLLYAANTNYIETSEEKENILSKVTTDVYQKINAELQKDNDYQRIQKIETSLLKHKYSNENIEDLLNDIKGVFFSDGTFDILEKNMFRFLKKLLTGSL